MVPSASRRGSLGGSDTRKRARWCFDEEESPDQRKKPLPVSAHKRPLSRNRFLTGSTGRGHTLFGSDRPVSMEEVGPIRPTAALGSHALGERSHQDTDRLPIVPVSSGKDAGAERSLISPYRSDNATQDAPRCLSSIYRSFC